MLKNADDHAKRNTTRRLPSSIRELIEKYVTVKPLQSEHRRDRRKSFSITGCS